MKNMEFSVIVCTYNRSHNLPRCVGGLVQQQQVEDLDWEVVIVDNNSTDNTEELVKGLQVKFSIPIRYVFEKKQGLNHARNRGMLESNGQYFAYTRPVGGVASMDYAGNVWISWVPGPWRKTLPDGRY
jgi:glycosyltransferase involved in cell wall biosynthesis